MKKLYPFVLLPLILCGCAYTSLTRQFVNNYSEQDYSKVLVIANFYDLSVRSYIESAFKRELAYACGNDLEVWRYCDIFMMGNDISLAEFNKEITGRQIHAVISISEMGSGTQSTYIPETTRTQSTATIWGNTIRSSSTTKSYGGYYINKPYANYEIKFWSYDEDKVIWYATANSRGNAFADWRTLIDSAAKKAVVQIVKDGLLD